uniref:Uncharacterized protein n=1 Tax=Oryza rufipogon TaxID=4529 RepID=A0A0E0QG29_ORYRU
MLGPIDLIISFLPHLLSSLRGALIPLPQSLSPAPSSPTGNAASPTLQPARPPSPPTDDYCAGLVGCFSSALWARWWAAAAIWAGLLLLWVGCLVTNPIRAALDGLLHKQGVRDRGHAFGSWISDELSFPFPSLA